MEVEEPILKVHTGTKIAQICTIVENLTIHGSPNGGEKIIGKN